MFKPNEEFDLGRLAFETYNEHPPVSTTHDGKPVPGWDEIPDSKSHVKDKWNATIRSFVRAAQGGVLYGEDGYQMDCGVVPTGDSVGDLLLMHRNDSAVIPYRWMGNYWQTLHNEYRSIRPGEPQYVPWTIVGARALPAISFED